ncbi:hypothetical protein TIFTF001_016287 [Ficus carica]|uniref:Uncharacterized protein n=1 Tax=Ficus carica TaxID=3494 RepID=A0AA88A611_FICCA|nr:hypothetical protein TIFTF001_016287 [Ficus carica]
MRSDGFEHLKESCPSMQSELLKVIAGCDDDCSSGGGKTRSVWAQLSDGGDTNVARRAKREMKNISRKHRGKEKGFLIVATYDKRIACNNLLHRSTRFSRTGHFETDEKWNPASSNMPRAFFPPPNTPQGQGKDPKNLLVYLISHERLHMIGSVLSKMAQNFSKGAESKVSPNALLQNSAFKEFSVCSLRLIFEKINQHTAEAW